MSYQKKKNPILERYFVIIHFGKMNTLQVNMQVGLSVSPYKRWFPNQLDQQNLNSATIAHRSIKCNVFIASIFTLFISNTMYLLFPYLSFTFISSKQATNKVECHKLFVDNKFNNLFSESCIKPLIMQRITPK